jgi:hypothetical protein
MHSCPGCGLQLMAQAVRVNSASVILIPIILVLLCLAAQVALLCLTPRPWTPEHEKAYQAWDNLLR